MGNPIIDSFQSFLRTVKEWLSDNLECKKGRDLYDIFVEINKRLSLSGSASHYTGFSELLIYKAILSFLEKEGIELKQVPNYEWNKEKFKRSRRFGKEIHKDEFWEEFSKLYLNEKYDELKEIPNFERFNEIFNTINNEKVSYENRREIFLKLVEEQTRKNFLYEFNRCNKTCRIGMNQRFHLKNETSKKQIIPDILITKKDTGKIKDGTCEWKIWRIFEIKIYPAYGQQTIKEFLEKERMRRKKYNQCYNKDFKGIIVCWHRYFEEKWKEIMQKNEDIVFIEPWFLQGDGKSLFKTLEGYLEF